MTSLTMAAASLASVASMAFLRSAAKAASSDVRGDAHLHASDAGVVPRLGVERRGQRHDAP